MSKHNRRRTRLRPSTRNNFHVTNFELPALPSPWSSNLSYRQQRAESHESTALQWQSHFSARKRRETKLNKEKQCLKVEQRRLFGGDSQDEEDADDLCAKMLEYFNSLDYLPDWTVTTDLQPLTARYRNP